MLVTIITKEKKKQSLTEQCIADVHIVKKI